MIAGEDFGGLNNGEKKRDNGEDKEEFNGQNSLKSIVLNFGV